LKSTETWCVWAFARVFLPNFSNFGSLKSTETLERMVPVVRAVLFQQFRLVEEH